MRYAILIVGLILVGCASAPTTGDTDVVSSVLGKEARIAGDILPYGFPSTGTLRYREGYVLSYDGRNRVPTWVAERLNPKRLERKVPRMDHNFMVDESLPPGLRSTSEDYAGSGYVRGRVAAAANHRNDAQAYRETYLLSNVVPQLGDDFRMSYWVHLEKQIRVWGRDCSDLYVVTGALYLAQLGEDGKTRVRYEVIGENKVAVPTHFYKVLLREIDRKREMLAFVIPHKALTLETPFSNYLVSVDEVERLAGLNFFRDLDESVQNRLEAVTPKQIWGGEQAKTEAGGGEGTS
ncbi:MAG: DNA/RNA non-specific endonuclease [Planctomycetota bacterium]